MLEVNNLNVQFGRYKILKDVNFSVEEGQWLMIIGPNGAGKSTIVNAIAQGIPYSGEILIEGKDIKQISPNDRAKFFGVLSQNNIISYSFTVKEVVSMGRYAYSPGFLSNKSDMDEQLISNAIEITGLTSLINKSVLSLSGGELQRVFLAQLFAQNPRLLILDEPTNHLDLLFQKQIFSLIENWLEAPGRAVVSVIHDLSLAKSFGRQALLMDKGCTRAFGDIKSVMTSENLQTAYSMDVYDWMKTNLYQWK